MFTRRPFHPHTRVAIFPFLALFPARMFQKLNFSSCASIPASVSALLAGKLVYLMDTRRPGSAPTVHTERAAGAAPSKHIEVVSRSKDTNSRAVHLEPHNHTHLPVLISACRPVSHLPRPQLAWPFSRSQDTSCSLR